MMDRNGPPTLGVEEQLREALQWMKLSAATLEEAGKSMALIEKSVASCRAMAQSTQTLLLQIQSMIAARCPAMPLVLWALAGGPYTVEELVEEFAGFVKHRGGRDGAEELRAAVAWLDGRNMLARLPGDGPVRYQLKK